MKFKWAIWVIALFLLGLPIVYAEPCPGYDTQLDCESDMTCQWFDFDGGECARIDCFDISNQTGCDTNLACEWDEGFGECIPIDCNSLGEFDCEPSGCYWLDGFCEEQVMCDMFGDQTPCKDYGCYWMGDYCTDDFFCNNYFDEQFCSGDMRCEWDIDHCTDVKNISLTLNIVPNPVPADTSFLVSGHVNLSNGFNVTNETVSIFLDQETSGDVMIFSPETGGCHNWMSSFDKISVRTYLMAELYAGSVSWVDYDQQSQLIDFYNAHLSDGEVDVIIILDIGAYEFYHGENDSSRAETWLDNGNMILWTGDLAFYMYINETGACRTEGASFGGVGEVLDSDAGVSLASCDNVKNQNGDDYLPSLIDSWHSNRCIDTTLLSAYWSNITTFADDGTDSDAIAIINDNDGIYAQFYVDVNSYPSTGSVIEEFIENWLFESQARVTTDFKGDYYYSLLSPLVPGPYRLNVTIDYLGLTSKASEILNVTVTEEGVCYCSSCADCIAKIGNSSCLDIRLDSDILNQVGNCMANPPGFSGKTFDCQGHIINGATTGTGIYLDGYNGFTVKNCDISGFNYNIYLRNLNSCNIMGNSMSNPTYNGLSAYTVTNCVIENNEISSVKNYGAYAYNIYDNSFINNTISGGDKYGVYLGASLRNNFVDNVFSDGLGGFYFYSSNDNYFSNNVIYDYSEYGIYFQYGSNINNFENNSINGEDYYYFNSQSNLDISGFDFSADRVTNLGRITLYNCTNITIHDVNISNNGDGINVMDSVNITIRDLMLFNNTGSGVKATNMHNSTISGIYTSGNTYGIYLDESYENSITGNEMHGDGLLVYNDYNLFVEENTVNGRELLYLIGENGVDITNVGQAIIIDSSDVTIFDEDLSNTAIGVVAIRTDNININNTLFNDNGGYGLYLVDVEDISIHNSVFTNTEAIYHEYGKGLELVGSQIHNGDVCVWLESINDTFIDSNTITDCYEAIYCYDCNNFSVIRNDLLRNYYNVENYGWYERLWGVNVSDNYIFNSTSTGIYLDETTGAIISDNTIEYVEDYGIYAGDSDGAIISGNEISNVEYVGLEAYRIENYTISRNKFTDCEYGMEIYRGENVDVIGNELNNVLWYGIEINYMIGGSAIGNIVNSSYYGFYLYSTSDYLIQDNVVDMSNWTGIYVYSSNDIQIIRNSVTNGEYGIYNYRSTGSSIISNIVYGSTYDGILVYYNSQNALVKDNIVFDNDNGIFLGRLTDGSNVSSNWAYNSTNGIRLTDADNSYFEDNELFDNEYGIYLESTADWSPIIRNHIYNNDYGIYSDIASNYYNYNEVCDNELYDFYSANWWASSGDDNYCDSPDGWNDQGTTGCTYICGGGFGLRPKLLIGKKSMPYVYVGNNLTYTITVKNIGNGTAYNITINDTLPTGMTHVLGGELIGNFVSWNISELIVDENASFELIVQANSGAAFNTVNNVLAEYYMEDGSYEFVTNSSSVEVYDWSTMNPVDAITLQPTEIPLITGFSEPFRVTIRNIKFEEVLTRSFLKTYYWSWDGTNPNAIPYERGADYYYLIPPRSELNVTLDIIFGDDVNRNNLAVHVFENSTGKYDTKAMALTGIYDVIDPVNALSITALDPPLITGRPELFNCNLYNNRPYSVMTKTFIKTYYWNNDRDNPNAVPYERSEYRYVEIPGNSNITVAMNITFGDDVNRNALACHAIENSTGKQNSLGIGLSGELDVIDPVKVLNIKALDAPLITGMPELFNVTLYNNRPYPVMTRTFIKSYYWNNDLDNPNAIPYERSDYHYVDIPGNSNVTLTMNITFGDDVNRNALAAHGIENSTGKQNSLGIGLSGELDVLDPIKVISIIPLDLPLITARPELFNVTLYNNRPYPVMTRTFIKSYYWNNDLDNPNAIPYERSDYHYVDIPGNSNVTLTMNITFGDDVNRNALAAHGIENSTGKQNSLGISLSGASDVLDPVEIRNLSIVEPPILTSHNESYEVTFFNNRNETVLTRAFVKTHYWSSDDSRPDNYYERSENTYFEIPPRTELKKTLNLIITSKNSRTRMSAFAYENISNKFDYYTIGITVYGAPTISNVAHESVNLDNDTIVNISATVTDDLGLSKILLFHNASGVFVNTTMENSGSTYYSSFIISLSNPEFDYYIYARDTDGYVTTSPIRRFETDRTPPDVSLVSPIGNDFTNSKDLRFVASDLIDPTLLCNVSVDGIIEQQDVSVDSGSQKTVTISSITEGPHSWFVTCWDGNDNLGTSLAEQFIYDETEPVVTLISPGDSAQFFIDAVDFDFSVIDNFDDILECSLVLNGETKDQVGALNDSLDQLSATGLESNTYTWSIECSDEAGNKNTVPTRTLSIASDIDITNMVIDPTAPLEGSVIIVNFSLENLGDVDSDVRVQSLIDDVEKQINTFNVEKQSTSAYSLSIDLDNTLPGQRTITLRVIEGPLVDSNLLNNEVSGLINVIGDTIAPEIIDHWTTPINITENSGNIKFNIGTIDTGVGIDTVTLYYKTGGVYSGVSMIGPNPYSVTLNSGLLDVDSEQGKTITYYFTVEDKKTNLNQTDETTEYIDIIDDVPIVEITAPDSETVWSGSNLITWDCDNDYEGPCYSEVYYWGAYYFAPEYPDEDYFVQGEYVLIGSTNESFILWDTSSLSGMSKIKLVATDTVYTVETLSDAFAISNKAPTLTIDNHIASYLVAPEAKIYGTVESDFSNIDSLIINDTNFVLTQSPIGEISGEYEFSSITNVSDNFHATITVSDELGNTNITSGEFVLDDSAPVINSIQVVGEVYTGAKVTINADVTDNYGVIEVLLTLTNTTEMLYVDGLYTADIYLPNTPGDYEFLVNAKDKVGLESESSLLVGVVQGPDLVVNSIVTDPDNLDTGEIVTINATIENIGDLVAENVLINAYVDGSVVASSIIDVTDSSIASMLFDTTGYAGDKTIKVRIEQSTEYYESDYTNNEAETLYFIDGPDFTVNSISFTPEESFSGETVKIEAVVESLKDILGENVRVNFYLNEINESNLIGYKFVDFAGIETKSVEQNWITAGLSGDQEIIVVVNPYNLPAEIVKDNNDLSQPYYITIYYVEKIPDTLSFDKRELDGLAGEKIRSITSGNFDSNDRIDFAIGTESGEIVMYNNLATTYSYYDIRKNITFEKSTIDSIGEAASGMTSGDFYEDGYQDIIIGTESGDIIFYNNTAGTFDKVMLFNIGSEKAYGLTTADYDNDGDLDLVIGTILGQVALYTNQGVAFTFDRFMTTREEPFGMTSGDYDLDGKVDLIVGDRLGQIERVVYESGEYRNHLFADIGAFAHGLSTADIDLNGRLDLLSISFDGKLNLFYSREGGLVLDPLVIGEFGGDTYAVTSGDYDLDNDIDVIVASDNGALYLLVNTLEIQKESIPFPIPTSRSFEVTTNVNNPWAKEITNVDVLEEWLQDDVYLIEDNYTVCTCCLEFMRHCNDLRCRTGDMKFYDDEKMYLLDLPNTIYYEPTFEYIYGACFEWQTYDYDGAITTAPKSIDIVDINKIFERNTIIQKETVAYQYKLMLETDEDVLTTTKIDYEVLGDMSTPESTYLLSDDVNNIESSNPNIKNLGGSSLRTDKDDFTILVIPPDFEPYQINYTYKEPPGNLAACLDFAQAIAGGCIDAITETESEKFTEITAKIRNNNNIAISYVTAEFYYGDEYLGSDTFNISEYGISKARVMWKAVYNGTNVITVKINPSHEVIETNYSNNEYSEYFYPTDLSIDMIEFSPEQPKEGQSFTISTTLTNHGNRSIKQALYYYGLKEKPECEDWLFEDEVINCSPESTNYDEELCDGYFFSIQEYLQSMQPGFVVVPRIKDYAGLEPGETKTIERTITAGDQTIRSQGGYDFSIIVGNSPASDMDLSNNALYSKLNILPSQVDLRDDYSFVVGCLRTAHGIRFANPEGDTIIVSFGNKNNGGEDANNYKIRVYSDNDDSSIMHTFDDVNTINHTSKQFEFTHDWSIMEQRDYPITLELDFEDVINETNEGNNKIEATFKWKELIAKDLWFSIDEPRPEDDITISTKIENKGDIRTGNFNVGLYIDDVLVDVLTTSLLARDIKTITFAYTVPDPAERTYNVKVVLDYDDVITENNEANNVIDKELLVFPELNWEINILSKDYDVNHLATYEYVDSNWEGLELGFESFAMEYGSSPVSSDLDSDGQVELIAGSLDGKLMLYNYTEDGWNETIFKPIDVGARSSPTFADLNGDGTLDLIVGNAHGLLYTYEGPLFEEVDWGMFNLSNGNNIVPAFFDIDLDNDSDLLIGSSSGLEFYENIGDNKEPDFILGTISLSVVGTNLAPTAYDFDDDLDPDLFIGLGDGTLAYYENNAGLFTETDIGLPTILGENAKITLFDDYLVVGYDNSSSLDIRKGYTEPIKAQIVNYAKRDLTYAIKLEYQNISDGEKITDILFDTGINVPSLGAVEKNYDIDIPSDLPEANIIVNSIVKLNIPKDWVNQPELGGYTTYLDPKEDALYEIDKTHRVYIDGVMSEWEYCDGYCQLKHLEVGVQNKIIVDAASAKIYEYQSLSTSNYNIVEPLLPQVNIHLDNPIEFSLKPGYIENIDFSVYNNNRADYDVDRIVLQIFDFNEYKLYDLYTDTNGFTLPSHEVVYKSYDIQVPTGLPKNSSFIIRIVTKQGLHDNIWYRNNMDEWPDNILNNNYVVDGTYYEEDLLDEPTDEENWGWQSISETKPSYLRKHFWASGNTYKAEYNELAGPQYCILLGAVPWEPVPHITTWVNGNYKETMDSEAFCKGENWLKWRPFFNDLEFSSDNSITLFQHSYNNFLVNLYKDVGVSIRYDPVTLAEPAFSVFLDSVGENGFLRRGYEEKVNITIENNDDDNLTVNVVSFDLVNDDEIVHLLTDTTPVILGPESVAEKSYLLLIPTDVPLDSRLRVQVEKIYEFADKLWLRNSVVTEEELIALDTNDEGWGDTLPTPVSSNYRKHIFAPLDVTRMEMVLGSTGPTSVYLNSEYQGTGYTGWSPVAVDSGLIEGADNLISVIGNLPNTESKIYSGDSFTDGTVIDVEQEVFYTIFGVRESSFVPGREKFYVYPGENITARIKWENYYNKDMDFTFTLSVVDFENNNEITLHTDDLQVGALDSEYVEIDLIIPSDVSFDTKLQLYNIWNDELSDKNWLRASNVDDAYASNRFLDDSSWGVISVGTGNENAKYFRKHIWIDSHTQGVYLDLDNVEDLWVNGILVNVPFNGDVVLQNNEVTKSDDNIFVMKAEGYNIDADVTVQHFVPVRTTDIELYDVEQSPMTILEQDSINCYADSTLCNCSNEAMGECTYTVRQSDIVRFNFNIRNTGELFARDFVLSVYAKNLFTNEITEFASDKLTMHPFSDDLDWKVVIDTKDLAGNYEFVVFVDSEDTIIESSEFNNKYSVKVLVNSKPVIEYIDVPVLTGYNADVNIEAKIVDESRNLGNITSTLDSALVDMSKLGELYTYTYKSNNPSPHNINILANDSLRAIDYSSLDFGIYSSLYLNVKTDKDIYYYGEAVELTKKDELGIEKVKENNAPIASFYDTLETVKGGYIVEIQAYAYDKEGDIITLEVCKDIGCSELYCSSTANLNPSCTFEAPHDDLLHHFYAYVKDKQGLSSSVFIGDYITDSTAPKTEVYTFASGFDRVDKVDDSKTIVVVKGDENIRCRFGFDDEFLLHKDRTHELTQYNRCENSGLFSVCNLGDLDKDLIPREDITNLSKVHISCTDYSGNDQSTGENLDIDFDIDFSQEVYDDYDGSLLALGDTVNIYGSTEYCVDSSGECMPNLEIDDAFVTFNNPGVWHLRYYAGEEIKDTTILVNTELSLDVVFVDHTLEHAFDVVVEIDDIDSDQDYGCTLGYGNVSIDMEIEDKIIAIETIYGSHLETIDMDIECSDKFDIVSSNAQHNVPNIAPILRNIPDIALKPNNQKTISLLPLTYDLENDDVAYEIVSLDNPIVDVVVNHSDFTIQSHELIGTAELCLRATDSLEGEVGCTTIIVQDITKSKLVNNEVVDTNIDLMIKVQYNDSGSFVDVYEDTQILIVNPGEDNAIDLGATLGSWNTITSPYTTGEFRIVFEGVNEENETLVNRDSSEILSYYDFVINHLNTAPVILEIPEQGLFEGHSLQDRVDLIEYTEDNEQNIFNLNYSIVSQSNPAIDCFIGDNHYIDCNASEVDLIEFSIVNVSAFDGYLYGYREFTVKVYPLEEIVIEDLAYTFSPPIGENGTWQTELGDAGVYDIEITETGTNYSMSKNITITVLESNVTNVTIYPVVSTVPNITNPVPNEEVFVKVNVNMTGTESLLGAYGMNITWEPDVLEFVSVFGGTSPGYTGIIANTNEAANGTIILSYFNVMGAGELVNVAQITFKAVSEVSQSTSIAPIVTTISTTEFEDLTDVTLVDEGTVTIICTQDSQCEDSLWCNGAEICENEVCVAGTSVECSGNDVFVDECSYSPDDVYYTYDYYSFTSSCDEDNDECTSAPIGWEDSIVHNCNITECGAECAVDVDCDDSNPLTTDSCTGGCACENTVIGDCIEDSDCDDGLYCNGDETCVNNNCQAGTAPIIDDGVGCTDDSCDDVNDIIVNAVNDANCDDTLWCNGAETCDATLDCQAGTVVDCSNNNIDPIESCLNDPDNNPFTWDYSLGFTSECDEDIDECTSETVDITHTCSVDDCSAECDSTNVCPITDCDYLDDCVGDDYYDYNNITNVCLGDCSCEINECDSPIVYVNDSRCIDVNVPPVPEKYVGIAYLNDVEVLDGILITVEVEGTGEIVGNATTASVGFYNYVLDVLFDDPDSPEDEGAEEGDSLVWKIDGIITGVPAPGEDKANSGEFNYTYDIYAYTGCTDDLDCDDSLYCNGQETCDSGICLNATPVDCSGYNLDPIETCFNDPDGIDYTYDYYVGFTSTCDDELDLCTTATIDLTHTCSVVDCSAECDAGNDCDDTDCDYLDGCQGLDYYDYNDIENICESGCTCTSNECEAGIPSYNDSRCIETIEIELYVGWNLISLPIEPIDDSITGVLSSILENCTIVWAYKAEDSVDQWKSYSPLLPDVFNDLHMMEARYGYWILMTENSTLTIAGTRVSEDYKIPLVEGYNLIGMPLVDGKNYMLPISLETIEGDYTIVWAYKLEDALDPWKSYSPLLPSVFNDLDSMDPTYGYWVSMDNESILEVG